MTLRVACLSLPKFCSRCCHVWIDDKNSDGDDHDGDGGGGEYHHPHVDLIEAC